MKGMTLHAHRVSVALMGAAVLVATGDGFVQSWAGLYEWATGHGLHGWKAMAFPAMVDLFILVGELGLFTLALEGHKLTRSGLSWLDLAVPAGIAAAGWLVSLAFNVGTHTRLADQLTAAVPPVASMLGLLVLLRTLHRVISRGVWEQERPTVAVERTDEAGVPAPVPAVLAPVPDVPEAVPAVPGGVPERLDETASGEPAPWMRPVGAFTEPGPVPAGVPAGVPAVPDVPERLDEVNLRAEWEFIDDITAGRTPGVRAIKQALRVGQPRAKEIQAYLAVLAEGGRA